MDANAATSTWVSVATLIAAIVLVAPKSHAKGLPQVSAGDLTVESVGASSCPYSRSVVQGQQVRLRGSGFAGGTEVRVDFSSDIFSVSLGPTTADSSGAIDMVTTIPTGYSTPAIGGIEASGAAMRPAFQRYLSQMIYIGTTTSVDTDSDGVPDFCDNCPSLSNATQVDDDGDGAGNICDPCPMSGSGDPDGDGLCSDVDDCPYDADNDSDGDGVCGNLDNCPNDRNARQEDSDFNGVGDACQTNPTCADGLDNDNDGQVDYPADPGCESASDTTETSASLPCDDGLDNDTDALRDFRTTGSGDPGCASLLGSSESPECNDKVDNDGDGAIDWDGVFGLHDADPECGGVASHDNEAVAPAGSDYDSQGLRDQPEETQVR